MVSFAALRDAEPESFAAVAVVFRMLAESVIDRADDLAGTIARLAAAWQGAAANAALARLASIHGLLVTAYPALVGVDQTLSEFGIEVAADADALTTAIRPRPGSIVSVGADGVARIVPDARPADPGDMVDLLATRAAIADAIAAATTADEHAATRLAATSLDPPAITATVAPPAAGTDPATVAAWWAGLTGDERRYLILARPDAIDRLDGIPIDARDQAARLLLHEQQTSLAAAIATAAQATQPTLTAELAGLSRLETRLDNPRADRAYLLGVDALHNEAIVSVGNPDLSANVLTMVPGVGSGMTDTTGTLAAIDNIHTAAGGNLATVAWIGYPAPRTLRDASTIGPADDAAAALSRFDLGLRDSHAGPPAHDSMLGYSYGSTVVGVTAGDGGLHDDDIILVGSPGVGVDHAADLGIDPSHVWATVARHDAIRAALDPASIVPDLLRGQPLTTQWFGTSPVAPAFGARVFSSDPGSWRHPVQTHERYFDAGNRGLTNIAKIATGDVDDVS